MKRTRSKGGIFTSMFIMLAIYLFSMALVIIFFYFFKIHITITMVDEYRWNKIQEIPLSLLSMDIDGERFVSKMNKVYYLGSDVEKTQFRDEIDGIITNQLFYIYEETTGLPYTFTIKVDEISITKFLAGCTCEKGFCYAGICDYYCAAECPEETSGDYCRKGGLINRPDHSVCIPRNIPRRYSAEFPFPLTFNGTDKFIETMSYEIVEKLEE